MTPLRALAPTPERAIGAGAGVLAAVVASPALMLARPLIQDADVRVILAAVMIAAALGWLLGPVAAKPDRWSILGAGVAASFLGALLGAFVLAGVAAPIWTSSIPEAVGYTLLVGSIGFFVGVAPVMVASVPVVGLWLAVVQLAVRMLGRGSQPPPPSP